MEKDNFLRKSFLLTLSNLTTGILGFVFSIILSKELGPEGMGVYGLVMPIYNLIIYLICGGIVIAISKLSAEYLGKNDYYNLHRTISTTIKFNFLWSTFIIILFYIFSVYISTYIIKDIRTINALKIVSPAMLFIAISNSLKGYFYGVSKILVPALIDILEKAMRIAILIILVYFFGKDSVEKTVTIAYAALLFGEFISLIMLYIYYKLDKNKVYFTNIKPIGRAQILFNVLIISLPLCLNGFIGTLLSTVSTLIVPRRLVFSGMEYKTALSVIGKFTGMSSTIVFFPLVVIGSISTLLIPDLSENISKKDYNKVERRISQVIRISYLLGFSTLIIARLLSTELGQIIYNIEDLGSYIGFLAFSAPIYFSSVTSFSILNGLGKQNIILRNSLIVSLLEVVLLYILIGNKYINIYGYGISLIFTSIINLILNIYEIQKYYKVRLTFFTILFDTLISVLTFYVLKTILSFAPNYNIVKIPITFLLGFSIIIILFFNKKVIKEFN